MAVFFLMRRLGQRLEKPRAYGSVPLVALFRWLPFAAAAGAAGENDRDSGSRMGFAELVGQVGLVRIRHKMLVVDEEHNGRHGDDRVFLVESGGGVIKLGHFGSYFFFLVLRIFRIV